MKILPHNLLLPQRTVSGFGSILKLSEVAADFGKRGMIVHGNSLARSGELKRIQDTFNSDFSVTTYCHNGGEPTVDEVDKLRLKIKEQQAEWVATIGGGSVMDIAKAAAGLVEHPENTAYYQANPSEIKTARVPLIAAPTTAGTGSEATVVSVLTDTEKGLKQSIRHESHMPKVVILDPQLLASCPPSTIAAAGLDAFIQAFESYTSRFALPFTKALAECAIEKIAGNLLPLYRDPANTSVAEEMLEASYITGLAFSHSRLGIIHGLAHPFGVRFKVAHGLACACILPTALKFNREQIEEHIKTLEKRTGVDVNLLVFNWMQEMHLENPFKGKTVSDIRSVIKETLASGSTKANPREVTAEDVKWLTAEILRGE